VAKDSFRSRIIETSQDELRKLRSMMPASGDRRMIVEIAGAARALIKQRTLSGVGVDGAPFAAYGTKPYRASIDKRAPGVPAPRGGRAGRDPAIKGRKRARSKTRYYAGGYGEYKAALGRGSRPQLSLSGRMLGAMAVAVTGPRSAVIFFSSRLEAAKAHAHQYGTTVPKREFFGIEDVGSEMELNRKTIKIMRETAKRAKLLMHG
jgi:hypothetical protein